MKKILLLINPRARSGSEKNIEISMAIKNAGHEVIDLLPDEQQGDFRKLIYKYKNDIDLVVLGGGDGTINFVLPALVETKLPLIIFPMGTANLLARSFNIKADVRELVELIETGTAALIDLGSVNGIYFINVCGLGISTEVNKKISDKLKKFTGPFSFWIMGIKLRKKLKPFKIKLTIDGKGPVIRKTWQVTICNGRKYAAWMTIKPDASYDDNTLRLLSTEIKKWWQGVKLLPSYLRGDYKDDLEVNYLCGKEIIVETTNPLLIDVDGDVQTSTPAHFKVEPKRLWLVVPKACLTDSSPISLKN